MAVMTPSIVSSTIFCKRNIDKGNDGHPVRYLVALGQGKKIFDYVKSVDNVVGQTANTASMALGAISNESIFLKGAKNVVNVSSKYINPLIVLSAGLDVLNSENKTDAAIVSATSLGSMFTVEKLMKNHLKDVPNLNCFKGVSSFVSNIAKKTKYGKFIAPVIEGVSFAIGSITAYNVGNKMGNMIISEKVNKNSN